MLNTSSIKIIIIKNKHIFLGSSISIQIKKINIITNNIVGNIKCFLYRNHIFHLDIYTTSLHKCYVKFITDIHMNRKIILQI